ncbi:MAG: flagellar hook-length control protein FliK [Hydrogenovibrio sp.]
MIEQATVLSLPTGNGASSSKGESPHERQLLPKMNRSFSEAMAQALNAPSGDSLAGKLSEKRSDIQVAGFMEAVPAGTFANGKTAVMDMAAMLENVAGMADNDVSEKGQNLNDVLQQISLAFSPVNSGGSKPLPAAAESTEESVVLPGLVETLKTELETDQAELSSGLAKTSEAVLSPDGKVAVTDTVDTDSLTTATTEETSLSPDLAKTSEAVLSPDGKMAETHAVTASVNGSSDTGARVSNGTVSSATASAAMSQAPGQASGQTPGQVASAQAAEAMMQEPSSEKQKATFAAQAGTHNLKTESTVAKEQSLNAQLQEAKTSKQESSGLTLGQQGGSSQSNQQGQSAFSGQQQAQQQFMNQVQKQVVQAQQESVRASNEASMMEAEKVEKAEKVLGNLGLGMEMKKAAGLSITQPVRSPQWGQALGQKVTYMASQKIQEAKITLNPEKLGPIQVKLSLDKDHQAHISMVTQQGTTREAIENAMPRLKEMLESSGIGFGSFDLREENSADGQDQTRQDGRSGGMTPNGALGGDDAEALETTLRTVTSDNLVDYYA